jgi:hypothetical protein
MATFTKNAYMGAGPAWTSIGSNTMVFCSSLTDLTTNITVASYQDGTHIGNGDPGTDQCGANHANNVKYLTSSTMSVNGGNTDCGKCNRRSGQRYGSGYGRNSERQNGLRSQFGGRTGYLGRADIGADHGGQRGQADCR